MDSTTDAPYETEPLQSQNAVIAPARLQIMRRPNVDWKQKLTVNCGNFAEWYDFSAFGFLTDVIGDVFFPQNSKTTKVFLAFLVFGVAFLSRPVGALVLGRLGDKYGTKLAVELSMIIMAVSSVGVGIIPSFHHIKYFAPVLLILFRFLQGFAIGGQFISSMILFMDSTSSETTTNVQNNSRAWEVSSVRLASSVGFLSGNLISALLRNVLSKSALHSWGWRIPFLLGIVTIVPAFFLRYYVPNDPNIPEQSRNIRHIRSSFRKFNICPMLCFIAVVAVDSCAFYIGFIWLPVFMDSLLKPHMHHAFIINAISFFLSQIAFCPIAGILVDKYEKAPIMNLVTLALATLFPLGLFILQITRSAIWVLFFQTLLGSLRMLLAISYAVFFVDKFHPSIRVTSMSFAFNVSFAIFGGFSPAMSTLLQKVQLIAPSYLVTGSAILSLIGIKYSVNYHPPSFSLRHDLNTDDDAVAENETGLPNTNDGLRNPLLNNSQFPNPI